MASSPKALQPDSPHAEHDTPRPDPLDAKQVEWMVSQLSPRELGDFSEGLSKHLARLDFDRSAEARSKLLHYVRGWVISVTLDADQDWQQQMARTDLRLTRRDIGPPVEVARLREMLGQ